MNENTLTQLGFTPAKIPPYFIKNEMMVYESPLSEKIIFDLNRKEKGTGTVFGFRDFESFINFYNLKFNGTPNN